jgi:hypothetical protein
LKDVKLLRCSLRAALVLGFVALAGTVHAQTAPPLVRGDATLSAGWLIAAKDLSIGAGGKDWHSSAFGAAPPVGIGRIIWRCSS